MTATTRMSAEDWAEAEFSPGRDEVLAAFAGIAAALSEGTSLDALLGLIVAQVCELTGVSRCAVYLLDENTGTFPGHAGCQHGVDIGPGVRRSVAGLEADGFAREIVQTRAPVFVSDAALDPRPVRSAMRAWDVRAMLGVPMVLAGEVIGILYLDNEQQPHPFSRATRDISVAFADLAAMAIAQARATDGMRQTLRKAVRRNEILRRGAAIDETLAEVAVRGGGLADLASATSAAVRRRVAICDAGHRCRAAFPGGEDAVRQLSSAAQQSQAFRDAVAGLGGPGSVPVATGPFPDAGLPRQLLAPIWIADQRWGYVALAEGDARLGPLDAHAARHTARHAALLLAAVDRATPGHTGSGAASRARDVVRDGRSLDPGAPQLGAARLLLARADPADAERVVQDTLGPLLADHRTGADLLRTLVAFFGTCQSVRDVSRALGVHENTVRYRLGRVRELAGLDVIGSAADQLSVQLALQVLQLRGDLEEFHGS